MLCYSEGRGRGKGDGAQRRNNGLLINAERERMSDHHGGGGAVAQEVEQGWLVTTRLMVRSPAPPEVFRGVPEQGTSP